MKEDLVKRLSVRRLSRHGETEMICSEAAAEITRLREIERLARECRKAQQALDSVWGAFVADPDDERVKPLYEAEVSAERALDAALGE